MSAGVLYAASASGAFKTVDGGQTWTRADAGVADRRIRALALAPSQPQTLYAASGDRIHRSNDGGATCSIRWRTPVISASSGRAFNRSS